MKDFSNVTSQSLGQNGYCKFPNGLMIQWGIHGGSNNSSIIIYMPQSFMNTEYIIQGSIIKSGSDINVYTALPLLNQGSSYFYIDRNYAPTGVSSGAFNWFAIGRWK